MSETENHPGRQAYGRGLRGQYYDVGWLPPEKRLFVDAPSPYHQVDGVHSVVGLGISDQPILVGGVRNCCSVILLGSRFAGATHRYLETAFDLGEYLPGPEEYLPEAVQRMHDIGEDKLTAVVVGGGPEHYHRILAELKKQGIRVAGRYRYGRDTEQGGVYKDIAVVPRERRVIVRVSLKNGSETEYIELSPWALGPVTFRRSLMTYFE